MVTLQDIERARARIKDDIYMSPCAHSETFSKLTGNKVYFKLENLQMTGSFKERGALNKILTLTDRGEARAASSPRRPATTRRASPITPRARACSSTIVMPAATPLVKVTRTREYGAEVVLHGASYDEAFEEAWRRCARRRGSPSSTPSTTTRSWRGRARSGSSCSSRTRTSRR